MRRTRRHKYLQISVFFLIYSIIHVVSVSNKENENGNKTSKAASPKVNETDNHTKMHVVHNTLLNYGSHGSHVSLAGHKNDSREDLAGEAGHNKSSKHPLQGDNKGNETVSGNKNISVKNNKHNETAPAKSDNISETENKNAFHNVTLNHIYHLTHGAGHGALTKHDNATANDTKPVANETTSGKEKGAKNGTNFTCTPPAIKQFPRPLMGQYARKDGGIIIHIIVAIYMFLGLAIVCDEYFVASLDRICEELKMSPDVAGATFMAAGSSAPELATVVIGVFFAEDDIGISGVIGSAVFNIMFVISCCGLCSTAAVYLNWWPLIRDSFFYAVSILVMLLVMLNEEISWAESVVMLCTYVVYCIVLHFNTPLEKWAQTWPVPFKQVPPNEQSGLVTYKTLEETSKHTNYGMEWTSPEKQQENTEQSVNFGMEWSPERHQQSFANQLSGPALNKATTDPPPSAPAPAQPYVPSQQDYYRPKEYNPNEQVNPLVKPPEEAGWYALVSWATVFPIHFLCRKTMPDCRTEKFKNWYPFTFIISMIWISFYSYFMVWMITIIGYTMGIPDTVMGLTFVAAGVSVPDALSSIAVIKEGYGDMAVSNAVGSNVFDILICLGLPWFLKTAIVNPGTTVKVVSKGLTYSTLSLLSTVVFLVVATHLNGWKLDRKYGIILMIWYVIFIIFASLYELNIFGEMNPPVCIISDGW